MRWFRRAAPRAHPTRHVDRSRVQPGTPGDAAFKCTTCGRSDLPAAGGWSPPICQECDAAINFDALVESGELAED